MSRRRVWLGVAGLLPVLALLIGVQLSWLDRLDEAQRAELTELLARSAQRIAERVDEARAAGGAEPESDELDAIVRDVLGERAFETWFVEIAAAEGEREPLYRSHEREPAGQPVVASAPVLRETGRWVGFVGTGDDGAAEESWQEVELPLTTTPPAWLVRIRRLDGSLADVVARGRRQNLVVGGGLLGLLVAGAGLLLYGEHRARRLAEQELSFVAGVSHELRTPLTVIRTAGSNLRAGLAGDPERVREYGALIEREAERMGVRVERALRFARGAGEAVPFEDVDAAEVIDEAIESCSTWKDRRDYRVDASVQPDLPPLRGDRAALVSAVGNLLDNAIKYGPDGQTIRVAAGVDAEDRMTFQVVDEGRGIPARERSRVFEPFYRAESARRGAEGGAGLGLSVVAQVAAAHGGDVILEDAAGGTSFSLRIPLGAPAGTNGEPGSAR